MWEAVCFLLKRNPTPSSEACTKSPVSAWPCVLCSTEGAETLGGSFQVPLFSIRTSYKAFASMVFLQYTIFSQSSFTREAPMSWSFLSLTPPTQATAPQQHAPSRNPQRKLPVPANNAAASPTCSSQQCFATEDGRREKEAEKASEAMYRRAEPFCCRVGRGGWTKLFAGCWLVKMAVQADFSPLPQHYCNWRIQGQPPPHPRLRVWMT